MEGCAERRLLARPLAKEKGADLSKCRTEVAEAHGITWGRWRDPSRHRRNATFNATALAIAAAEPNEASLDSPRVSPRPSGPMQPLRAAPAAAADVDDDDD
jgi:hypothetical protein